MPQVAIITPHWMDMPHQDDIDQAEANTSFLGMREILYGGPGGEGLIYVVKRLVEATRNMQQTLEVTSHQLMSDNGVVSRLGKLEDTLEKERVDIQKKHDENKRNFRVLLGVLGGVITPLLTALVIRVLYLISNPIPTGH